MCTARLNLFSDIITKPRGVQARRLPRPQPAIPARQSAPVTGSKRPRALKSAASTRRATTIASVKMAVLARTPSMTISVMNQAPDEMNLTPAYVGINCTSEPFARL